MPANTLAKSTFYGCKHNCCSISSKKVSWKELIAFVYFQVTKVGYSMSTQTSQVSLNTDYIKSRIGILRVLEAVIGLCGIICESQGAFCKYWSMYSFYNFVVVTTLILAIIILIVFLLGLDKHCAFINCPMSVFINDVLFSVLYLIATILMFITIGACTHGQVARIFASLFGVCGTIVVGLLALDGYHTFRGNQSAPKSEPA